MTSPDDLAALHASAFDGAARWSAGSFAAAQRDPTCFFVPEDGDAHGFALGRVMADEVELLTLVVAPDRRRRGTATALLDAFERQAAARGAEAAFLEVSADNVPARALYARAGWREVGRRPGYYGGTDAIAMRKDLAGGLFRDGTGGASADQP
ncbi:GNAT family N-acetyltransferase [Jannaschia sp. LMIT008]|uniref:GNAT family N-acetyltransferase n=1 Tax=Jannaschia maritima TaxID=3032585 RepID=UPI0028125E46|nr:GNAT family N-acetyltransferase [Jannaschia sp. LMIT008]